MGNVLNFMNHDKLEGEKSVNQGSDTNKKMRKYEAFKKSAK